MMRTTLPVPVFLALFVTAGTVRAEPKVISAVFDPAVGPNEYVVVFPAELGGETIFMPIRGGRFELEVDAEAGTSRLLSWRQDVDPIEIFGMSTGPITITIDPEAPSEGTYDPEASNSFSVTALFVVEFDDTELREFGFVSPFRMTATETGSISGVGPSGVVRMFLEGTGEVAGSEFSYTCRTTARLDFPLEENQAQPGDVNMDRTLDISDPVAMLDFLFRGGAVACEPAVEVNGDAVADLSDPVYLLNYLFSGGPEPLAAPVDCF